MGTANVTCVSGCACNSTLLDGTWERRASLFTITRFEVRLSQDGRKARLGLHSWEGALPLAWLLGVSCAPATSPFAVWVSVPGVAADRGI